MKSRVVIACVLLSTVACSESLTIRSVPPGGMVSINDGPPARSPVTITVPRAQVGEEPVQYRVELDGYEPADGVAQPRVAPGRVIGMVMTAGITAIFRGPRYYPVVDVPLKRLAARDVSPRPFSTEDRLSELESLRAKGVISEDELRDARRAILGGR